MNLLEFRQYFRTHSGRYDLVDEAGADTGVGPFINAGQRYLDRLADLPRLVSRRFIDIAQGDRVVTFGLARAILEVWVQGVSSSGDLVRVELEKKGIRELKTLYPGAPETLDQARPIYYALAQTRLTTDDGTSGGMGSFMDVLADGHQTLSGLIFRPPADQGYSLELLGNFYSPTLTLDEDSSYWSEEHPTTLYMATMRQLEAVYRNTEGMRDWDYSIQSELLTLDFDGVAEESADRNEMEG